MDGPGGGSRDDDGCTARITSALSEGCQHANEILNSILSPLAVVDIANVKHHRYFVSMRAVISSKVMVLFRVAEFLLIVASSASAFGPILSPPRSCRHTALSALNQKSGQSEARDLIQGTRSFIVTVAFVASLIASPGPSLADGRCSE